MTDNRTIFLMLVQTGINAAQQIWERGMVHSVSVFLEAAAVPEDALPDDMGELGQMALEFLDWQYRGLPEPLWYKDEWIGENR